MRRCVLIVLAVLACVAAAPSAALALPGSGQFVWHGNSRVAGYGTTSEAARPCSIVGAQLAGSWAVVQRAIGGCELSTLAAQAPTSVDPLLDPQLDHNVVAFWEYVNELCHKCGGPISIHDQLRAYCLARRAAGWKVIVCTELTWTGCPYWMVDDFNELIRQHWAEYADGLADFAADPRLGYEGAEQDRAYWASPALPGGWDGWHLNDAGYAIVADIMQSTLSRLYTPVVGLPTQTTNMRRGEPFKVTCAASEGVTLRLRVYRHQGGAWRIFRGVPAAGTAGAYSATLRIGRPGLYRVRAVALENADWLRVLGEFGGRFRVR